MQGLVWESILCHPCSSSKWIYITSDMSGEERLGEGLNCMTSHMKGQGVYPTDQQYAREGEVILGDKSHREILVFPVLSVARHSNLPTLVTFRSWPVVLTLFIYNYQLDASSLLFNHCEAG